MAGRHADGMTMNRARVHARLARRKVTSLSMSCLCADVGAAPLLSLPCSLRLCASQSAMIQFRALAGPVLKHGPRSLACVRVIEINKLKGVTKVKACACRELREDGASV